MKFEHIFYCPENGHTSFEVERGDLENAYDHAWKDFENWLGDDYREDAESDEELEEMVQTEIDDAQWEHVVTYQVGHGMQ